MEVTHRYNTEERQHHLFRSQYSLKLRPRLLYAGKLEKKGGWQEEAHSHDFCEVLYVADGKGSVTLGKTEYRVQTGDIIIYNAGLSHGETSSAENPMELYFMALGGLKLTDLPNNHLLPPGLDCIYPVGVHADMFTNCFERMIPEFQKQEPFYAEITQNLALTLIMYLFRIINDRNRSTAPLLQSNEGVRRAINYIEENLHEELTLEQIARQCHMSKYYLSHVFSQSQGISVGKYVLQVRVNKSMRLLRDTVTPVKEIAEQVGFHDASYFIRAFKKETGLTPLQYRKQN